MYNKSLRVLELKYGTILLFEIDTFNRFIEKNVSLKELKISDYILSSVNLSKMYISITKSKSLKVVKLDFSLSNESIPGLLHLIQFNQSIEELILSSFLYKKEQLIKLVKCLKFNKTLKRLVVCATFNLEDDNRLKIEYHL